MLIYSLHKSREFLLDFNYKYEGQKSNCALEYSATLYAQTICFKTIFDLISVSCEDRGYLSLLSTKKCLKLYTAPMLSWLDANATCSSAGGNLFRITSAAMLADVRSTIAQKGN
jgi:hypothetical protein